MILRTMLGISISFFVIFFLNLPTDVIGIGIIIIGVFIFYLITKLTLRFRARSIDIPCERCPEGTFPFCSYKASEITKILEVNAENTTSTLIKFLTTLEDQLKNPNIPKVIFESEFIDN